MSLGRIVRRVLGDRYARIAGRAYRAIFVDLDKATAAIASEIPPGARVLDVGGGDGEPLNRLLDLRPDIRVTTIDVAPQVGQWIAAAHAGRVVRLPGTSVDVYMASDMPIPDVLLLSDVMHHIPRAERDSFLASVAEMLKRAPHLRIIVKDVEPGHLRASLGYLSDRYVTGDRGVELIARADLVAAMQRAAGAVRWSETPLYVEDRPNYALVFWR